jgi:hypothetical protein
MATYRYTANSVLEVLKQTYDDADVELELIAFWCSVVANRLRQQHLKKQWQDERNGTFLSVFDGVPVLVANQSQSPDTVEGRKHIQLPESLVELDRDGGIDYISYTFDSGCCGTPAWTTATFQRTKPSTSHRLYMSDYEKPSPENPYFYVVGQKVYFLGIECVSVQDVEIGIYSNTVPNSPCRLDDNIQLPEHLMEVLIAQVVGMGRFLIAYPKDRRNDGTDSNSDGGKTGFDRRTLGNPRATPENAEEVLDQQQ